MSADAPIRIRRYPNRRLYDRSRGRYVTLQEIEQLVLDGRIIEVTDSRDGSDITRQILTQILTERHPQKLEMFPIAMLHSIVRANDLVFEFWQSHFRALLAAMDGIPPAAPFPTALNWFPGLAAGVRPTFPGAEPADSTASRVAELEDRLRRLEAQSAAGVAPKRRGSRTASSSKKRARRRP